jgi:hypothetical protein
LKLVAAAGLLGFGAVFGGWALVRIPRRREAAPLLGTILIATIKLSWCPACEVHARISRFY